MTVDVYQQPHPVSAVPSQSEFALILRQADIISRSGIVPSAYKSTVASDGRMLQDKRANVVVATLTGRTFGWDALTAMRNIHVIEGAASLKPEAMLGMIRRAGHSVKIVRAADHATVSGKRVDTGDEMEVSFSFADGARAGLCSIGDNGQPRARSKDGKPLPWEQYPLDMCQWRAVAAVARGLFGDIVLGLGYTPEEMGELVTAEGEVIIESAPLPSPEQPAAPAAAPAPTAPPGSLEEHQQEWRTREQPEASPAQAQQTQPAAPLTADEEVEQAHARRASKATQRRGPQASKSRAWDALTETVPQWTQDERTAETRRVVAESLGIENLADVTAEQWTQLADMWESEADDGIRARHAAQQQTNGDQQ